MYIVTVRDATASCFQGDNKLVLLIGRYLSAVVYLLEAGVDGLAATKSWLDRSALRLFEKQGQSSATSLSATSSTIISGAAASMTSATAAGSSAAGTSAKPTAAVTPFTILNNAYIELTQWPENLVFPEVSAN